MKKYRINEIFQSIQGEGYWSGIKANFIRFSGCNLNCTFCDTKHGSFTSLTEIDILEKLDKNIKIVILTGGEPTLQIDNNLLCCLRDAGYNLHLETNGTNLLENYQKFDWITVSPKMTGKFNLRVGDEIKLLSVFIPSMPFYEDHGKFSYWWLMPTATAKNNNISEEEIKNSIVSLRPPWRLGCQIHRAYKLR